jgi:hypothetical protein
LNQELWRKVEDLFHAALERAPEARQSFLDSACDGDADLRREVEFLLSNEERAGSFLEVPAMEDMTVTLAAAPVLARQFGAYRILSPLTRLSQFAGVFGYFRASVVRKPFGCNDRLPETVAVKTYPLAS